jgi:hypothetical protein
MSCAAWAQGGPLSDDRRRAGCARARVDQRRMSMTHHTTSGACLITGGASLIGSHLADGYCQIKRVACTIIGQCGILPA